MIKYFAAFLLSLPVPAGVAQTTLNLTSFGAVANSGQDTTEPMRKAIAKAKATSGPVTILVPPGRYNFFLSSATVRDCYTSNSTERGAPQRHIAIDIQDVNHLTIKGPGATLMMDGQMTMLVAERCQNFSIKGLEFDFKRPPVSEITALSKDATSWIAQVHPDSTYRIEGGNRLIWTGDGLSPSHNQIQRFYHDGRVYRNNGDPTSGPSAIEDLGGGKLKFTGGGLGNVEVGVTYQFRDSTRNELGMWFNRCKNVMLEDVSVRAMHGFGILSQFTENVAFARLVVAPKEGSGRTCVSAADITHFSGCKGIVRLKDCYLSAAHDDAMNVHGTHLRIVGQPAPNKLRLQFMHHQSWGFQAFIPGDAIELVKSTTLLSYESANVKEVEKVSDYQWDITLDKRVKVGALNSDAVENVTWTPSVQVLNCKLANLSCRGLLLTTRKPILVEGNHFGRTGMAAILVEDDAAGWYESGPVHNLTIRGNTFDRCADPVLHFNPHYTGSHAGYVHKNITVENNDFQLAGRWLASAKSTGNLKFSNNRATLANGSAPAFPSLVSGANSEIAIAGDNEVLSDSLIKNPIPKKGVRVLNPDFDTPDQSSSNPPYSDGNPQGWTFTTPGNGGVESIRDERFGPVSGVAKPDQIGFMNLGNSAGIKADATSYPVGYVAPRTKYTLTVAFCQRVKGDRHPDASIGLQAGGKDVGAFTGFAGASLPSGITDKTYTWTSGGVDDTLVGKPLAIRLNFTTDASGAWQQAQFDNVRLTTAPAD